MSNNPNSWEEPFVKEVANQVVLENLSLDDDHSNDYVKFIRILNYTYYKYQPMYPHARLNPRIIKSIVDYVNVLRPTFNTTAVPTGSFDGPAVQATLIDTDDDGNIYGRRVQGKKNTLHKRLTSMFGITSKKPIATPVGGTRRKRRSKKSRKSKKTRKTNNTIRKKRY
jgi:hypothetical protein